MQLVRAEAQRRREAAAGEDALPNNMAISPQSGLLKWVIGESVAATLTEAAPLRLCVSAR
jgi:hypothetical protein